jgi:hypothetical protein
MLKAKTGTGLEVKGNVKAALYGDQAADLAEALQELHELCPGGRMWFRVEQISNILLERREEGELEEP